MALGTGLGRKPRGQRQLDWSGSSPVADLTSNGRRKQGGITAQRPLLAFQLRH